MRKSFDALSGIITTQMNRNPLSGEVFIFINRGRNRIKLLQWQADGFVLYYKRLEEGTFALQKNGQEIVVQNISWFELMMIIQGVEQKNIKQKKRYKHPL